MSLDAKTILQINDTSKVIEVDVPEWGGTVFLRVMSGLERDRWEIECSKDRNVRARLAFYCLCDALGSRLFSDPKDLVALSAKSGSALDRIFDAASTLNNLSPEDRKKIEKN